MNAVKQSWEIARTIADETGHSPTKIRTYLKHNPQAKEAIQIKRGKPQVPPEIIQDYKNWTQTQEQITPTTIDKFHNQVKVNPKSNKDPNKDPVNILLETAQIAKKYGGLNHIQHAIKVLKDINK